jgi:hypothetical protein
LVLLQALQLCYCAVCGAGLEKKKNLSWRIVNDHVEEKTLA